MTNSEKPEADALEQQREILEFDDPDRPTEAAETDQRSAQTADEVNPADAWEQRHAVGGAGDDEDYAAS
jgi:hypothetical protein